MIPIVLVNKFSEEDIKFFLFLILDLTVDDKTVVPDTLYFLFKFVISYSGFWFESLSLSIPNAVFILFINLKS